MKQLIIVESPSKAKTIQKYLGGDAAVLASKGHVCDLPQRTLGIDVEHGFKPQYVITPDKEETIKKLSQAVKKYDKVYLATDPDREGEAISWHLKNTLGIEGDKVRIEFNEISPKAVRAAMQNPREIDMNLVDSQQARRVLDRLVGYKISPILSRKIKAGKKSGLSAGRVQSAALKMIVDRENEIRNFKPEEYWNIFALLLKEGAPVKKENLFKAALNDVGGGKAKVTNGDDAARITDMMRRSHYVVDEVKKSVSTAKPAPPFTTSTLQQEANHKLNMAADRAMRVAQQLYEGVDIGGEGLHALITYIRTDSVRVSPDFARATLAFITENYGREYAPSSPNVYKTSANAQDAHEAIRPISLERTPKSLEGKIERDQYRLYKLIYERFLASQMKSAQYNTMRVHITGEGAEEKLGFVVKGRSVKFKGFTAVYTSTAEAADDDRQNELDTLPDLNEGERLDLNDVTSEQKFTKPPARYNDATLVKAMEENGIGRPSTYASIISVLARREYTEKENKFIKPTQLGEIVCDYMEKNFPDIMSLNFTARLEGALDKVADGGQQWQELIGAFYPRLQKFIDRAYHSGGGRLPDEESDVVCDKCGAKMVVKDGKYGKFLACPNYPECKNIKRIVEVVGKCPKCGGDVVKKTSRAGKVFYGCDNYPKCDFTCWDLPAPKLCPDCGGAMRVSGKGEKRTYVCMNKACGHREAAPQGGEDK